MPEMPDGFVAYCAGYDDAKANIWNIGSWPEHLQDSYLDGHMAASWKEPKKEALTE